MSVITVILIFVLVWWMVFFAVLPMGVRSQVEDGEVVPGSEPGAPSQPKVWKKALLALYIASGVTATLVAVLVFTPISLDAIWGVDPLGGSGSGE